MTLAIARKSGAKLYAAYYHLREAALAIGSFREFRSHGPLEGGIWQADYFCTKHCSLVLKIDFLKYVARRNVRRGATYACMSYRWPASSPSTSLGRRSSPWVTISSTKPQILTHLVL